MNTIEKLETLLELAQDIKSEIMDRVDYIKNNTPKTNSLINNVERAGDTLHYVISDYEVLKQTALWLNNEITINRIKDVLIDIDMKIKAL